MMILNHMKWNKLLDAMKASNKFAIPINNHGMTDILAPATTLAFAIAQYLQLSEYDSLTICIAGAGQFDANNDGNHFKVLPELLGIKSIHVDLVGLEVNQDKIYHEGKLKASIGENVTTKIHAYSLQKYIETSKAPDVVMLNHPGFEKYAISWFSQDNAIEHCLNNNIPVLGCSYGLDEAEYDSAYAQSFGYKVSAPIDNPFHMSPCSSMTRDQLNRLSIAKTLLSGAMDWGRQVWKIEGKTAKGADSELFEVLELGTTAKSKMASETGEPNFLFDGFMGKTEDGKHDWVLIHFNPVLIYVVGLDIIVDEDGDVIMDEIQLDASYLKKGEMNGFKATLIAGIILNDYSDEIEDLFEVLFEEDDSEEDDSEEQEIDLSALTETLQQMDRFVKSTLQKKEHQMTEVDICINTLIAEEKWEAISSFPPQQLRNWLNNYEQNLFHVAAKISRIELYDIAKANNVDILHRDYDGFSFIDVCAEKDQVPLLLKAISDYDLDLDAADALGNTAMHRADSYDTPNVAQALVDNGANKNPANIIGMTPADMKSMRNELNQ